MFLWLKFKVCDVWKQGWYVLKNEFWKIHYLDAVNGKFGSFII